MFFRHNVTQKTGQLKKTYFFSHFENMEIQNLGQILLERFFRKKCFFSADFFSIITSLSFFNQSSKLENLLEGRKNFQKLKISVSQLTNYSQTGSATSGFAGCQVQTGPTYFSDFSASSEISEFLNPFAFA
jgi:hypothetical protein